MNKICRVENYLFCLVLFCILFGFVCGTDTYSIDLQYLYNRAYQMYSCFLDGNLPWFYYNDFNGVGYGSSFFYGQLTLLPFLPLVSYGIEVFINSYVLVTIIITYIGITVFLKRFTKNNYWISLLYCSSTFAYYTFLGSGTYSNLLGIGISFIFLAYCVDFFRDNKNFIKASLVFYIILNTHLISSLISFLLCLLLFLYYFDIKKLKQYIYFFVVTLLLCSYNIINILYHSDILNRMSTINQNIILGFKQERGKYVSSILYLSKLPFGGLLSNLIFGDLVNEGYHYFNWIVLIFGIFCLYKYSKYLKKRKIKFLIFLVIILSILSLRFVWFFINNIVSIPIQFSCRFAPYIIVFLLLLFFKDISKKRIFYILFLSCLPDLLIGSLFTWKSTNLVYTDYDKYIVNGEYLDNSFIFDLDIFEYNSSIVVDDKSNKYNFYKDKEKLYVYIDKPITGKLQIPKLYYNGYIAYDKETLDKYNIEKGYSQFITVCLNDYKGVIVVEYKHPLFLKILFFTTVLFFFYCYIYDMLKNKSLYKENF